MSPNILVVGATGKQGGKAAAAILAAKSTNPDLNLTFITRNPDSGSSQKLVAQGATPIQADLGDKASLVKALQGIDRAFFVTDAGVGEEKEAQQGITFVDAALEAGVKHLVYTSVGDADVATGVEQYLVSSGIPFTILRPVAFMDNFPTEAGLTRFFVIGFFFSCVGLKKVDLISTSDIGVFAGKALLDPEGPHFRNRILQLSAGTYGLDDFTRAIEKVQGHTPWFARYMTRWARSALPFDFKQMFIFFDKSGYKPTDVDELRRIHPGLLSLEDWFRENTPEDKRVV
ncbi:hypothetical protein I350_07862 [Cryptococcus amylolentus CBS 6273]|uniref:NmrA-like domain-containing protein n=1 Tax=Cryptococcus amylolentus CBS 6273 TaxID=1296118 RepID=A0A1E3JDN4_9TREE|nr:hypothetical protein I350_07862 [Cryptococcus amylolentus CBS 6273]